MNIFLLAISISAVFSFIRHFIVFDNLRRISRTHNVPKEVVVSYLTEKSTGIYMNRKEARRSLYSAYLFSFLINFVYSFPFSLLFSFVFL